MTTQPNDLESLRRAYARGELDATTYRTVRRALLVSIQGGALPASPLRPLLPPPARDPAPAPTIEVSTPAPASSVRAASPPDSERKQPAWLLGAVAAGVLAALGIGVSLMNGGQEAAPAVAVSEPVAAPSADETAIDTFVRDADWTAAKVTDVLASLERLQASGSRNDSVQAIVARLQRATTKRVEEQAALRMIEGAGDAGQPELIALARALDIGTDALTGEGEALDIAAAEQTAAAAPALTTEPIAEPPPAPETQTPVAATPPPPPEPEVEPAEEAAAHPPVSAEATTEVPAAVAPQPSEVSDTEITDESPGTVQPETETVPPAVAPTVVAPPQASPEIAEAPTPPATTLATSPSPPAEETRPVQEPAPAAAAPAAPAVAAASVKPADSSAASKSGCNALAGAKLDARRIPVCRDALESGGDGPTMLGIPGGTFTMGGSRPEEQPTREVRIPNPLAVAKSETSWAEYKAFATATGRILPPGGDDASLPVSGITWDDASAYAKWLSNQTGATYRLPTEAEWEYFARAGADTRWPDGNDSFPSMVVASVFGPRERPETAARGWTNRFKLVHMLGNVAEWVEDAWQPTLAGAPTDGSAVSGVGQRVVRGGAFRDDKETVTLSARKPQVQDSGADTIGFRVVRDLR